MSYADANKRAEDLVKKVVLTEKPHWKSGYKSYNVSLEGKVIGEVEQEDHTTHKMSGRISVRSTTKVMWTSVNVGSRSNGVYVLSRTKAIQSLLTTHLLREAA